MDKNQFEDIAGFIKFQPTLECNLPIPLKYFLQMKNNPNNNNNNSNPPNTPNPVTNY